MQKEMALRVRMDGYGGGENWEAVENSDEIVDVRAVLQDDKGESRGYWRVAMDVNFGDLLAAGFEFGLQEGVVCVGVDVG